MGPIIINILGIDCASIHFIFLFFVLYTHYVPGGVALFLMKYGYL